MFFNKVNLQLQQGVTFQLQLIITDQNTNPLDLTHYTATMYIKSDYSCNTYAEQLSTANGEISLGSNAGTYMLNLPATRTANVYVDLTNGSFPKTEYVYDFNLTSNTGINVKVMQGNVDFFGQV